MRIYAPIYLVAVLFIGSSAVQAQVEVKDPNPPSATISTVSPKIIGGPDAFGYTLKDQNEPGVAFSFVDISATGTQVLANGQDEGAALITLGAPFSFYGTTHTQLVMSPNGYLSTSTIDPGGDFTSDCPLPAVPSTGGGARIYPLHDDFETGGGGFYQFFPVSPIPGHDQDQIAQPASVFMWNDADHFPEDGFERFDFEVVLFHTTGEIFAMVGAGNVEQGAGSTTAIQNDGSTIALTYACSTGGSIPDNTAVAFLPNDAGSLNIPFFRDRASFPGFIGIKNVTQQDLTLTLVYTQDEDQGGGNFQPVDQAPQTFQLAANAAISWRPVQDDPGEGAGQAIPNTSTTDGSTPAAGSARLSWPRGGAKAIQGRYVEIVENSSFSFLMPPAIGQAGATMNVPFFRDSAGVPGFIGIKNTTTNNLTLTIVYTQDEDQGGGNFQPVDQAPQTFQIPPNAAISWRPVQDNAGEGAGQAVPNTSTTDGSTPAAGSARISWAQGGPNAIQGRYVETPGTPGFSYLIPGGN